MMELVKFVTIPFDDGTSSSLLLTFVEVSLGRIVAHNTGLLEGHFTDRIPLTRAAITAAEAVVTDGRVKIALQKARTEAKETFLAALPANVAKVYGAVLAAFGPDAPEMTECFPLGRGVFSKCPDEQVNNHLEQLQTAVTAQAAALPAATVTLAGGLVSGWAGVYSAAGAAKDATGVTAAARDAAIQTLRVELFKNIMTCGLYYPDDTDKAELLFPQHLLEGRTPSSTPGAATLALQGYVAQTHVATFTMSADGATVFRLYRRLAGEADMTQVSGDIPATDGAATFAIVLEGTAAYEFAVEGVSGTRTGERSDLVTVAQQ